MLRSRFVGLVVVLAVLVPAVAAFGSGDNVFQGSWVGTDPLDESRVMLIVGDGNNHVVYKEAGVTGCENEFGEFVGGSAAGFAEIDGNTLTFTGTFFCNLSSGRTPHPFFVDFDWVFSYDAATDTVILTIDPDTVLSRPGS